MPTAAVAAAVHPGPGSPPHRVARDLLMSIVGGFLAIMVGWQLLN